MVNVSYNIIQSIRLSLIKFGHLSNYSGIHSCVDFQMLSFYLHKRVISRYKFTDCRSEHILFIAHTIARKQCLGQVSAFIDGKDFIQCTGLMYIHQEHI